MSSWGYRSGPGPSIQPSSGPDEHREPRVTLVATVPVAVLDRVVGLARAVSSDLEILLGPTGCTAVIDAERPDLERIGQALILEGHEDLALVEDDVLDEVLRPHEAQVPAESRLVQAWLPVDEGLPDALADLAARLQHLGHPAAFGVTTAWSWQPDQARVAAGRDAESLLAEVDVGRGGEVPPIPDEEWMIDAPDAPDAPGSV